MLASGASVERAVMLLWPRGSTVTDRDVIQRMRAAHVDGFCEVCGVAKSLHYFAAPDGCGEAARKAEHIAALAEGEHDR